MKNNKILLIIPLLFLTSCGKETTLKKSYVENIEPIENKDFLKKYIIDNSYKMFFTWEYDKYQATFDNKSNYSIINEILENCICYQNIRVIGNHKKEIIFINSNNKFNIQFKDAIISSKYFVDYYYFTILDFKEEDFEKGYYIIAFKNKEYYEKLSSYYEYLKSNVNGDFYDHNLY